MEYPKITVAKKERPTGLEHIELEADRMYDVRGKAKDLTLNGSDVAIARRESSNLRGVSFYLDGLYDWVLGRDEEGSICLVPLKKE